MKRLFTGKPLFIKIEAIIVVPIIISDGEWAAVSPQEAIPRASPLTQPVGSEGGQYPASDSYKQCKMLYFSDFNLSFMKLSLLHMQL